MTSYVIVYTSNDTLTILNIAPSIDPQIVLNTLDPSIIDATILTTNDLPLNSEYSSAWYLQSDQILINISIAKEIHTQILKNITNELLKPLLEFNQKVIAANKDSSSIKTRINYLRNFPNDSRIAAATTIDDLLAIQPVDWDYPEISSLQVAPYSDDPRLIIQNVVSVKKNPGQGEYQTIHEAIASITTSSTSERYVIQIGPGTYIEPELVLPEYTSLTGIASNTVIITPEVANQTLITCSNNVDVEYLTLIGHDDSLTIGEGYPAISSSNITSVRLNNLIINSFDIAINQVSDNTNTMMNAIFIDIYGDYSYAIKNTSTNGFEAVMNLENVDIHPSSSSIKTCILSTGLHADINMQGCSLTGSGTGSGPGLGAIGLLLRNGTEVDIVGCLFYNMSGIICDQTDAGPSLKISGSIFNNCLYDFDIQNPNTTGYYIGYSPRTNYVINPNSLFFIGNENSNVLTVSSSGSNFTSIKAALDSITNSSETNVFTIVVGSGVFIEDEMTIPPYTSIMGQTINSTFIKPRIANQHLFIMGTYCELSFMSLIGHDDSHNSGYAAVRILDVGDFCQMHKVSVYGFDIGIDQLATGDECTTFVEYVDINNSGTYDVRNVSQNNKASFIQLENFYCYESNSNSRICVLNDGAATNMKIHVAGFIGSGPSTKGIQLQNGGHCDISAAFFENLLGNAIYIPNVGSGPNLQIESSTFTNCVLDFDIRNVGTTGYFFGYSLRSNHNIVTGASFFIAAVDAKLIRVAKRGGDFSSIKTAVNSITDSSFYNPYMIIVGPGLYFEYGIQMKTGIFLIGSVNGAVILIPPIPTATIIYGAEWAMIQDLVFSGAYGPGGTAIRHTGTAGDGFLIRDCAFTQNETNIHIHGVSTLTVCVVDRCITSGNVGYAHKVTNENNCPTRLTLLNLLYQDLVQPVCQYFAHVSGPGTILNSMNCMLNIVPTQGSTGYKIENGAYVNLSGNSMRGFGKAIHVTSVGAAPSLYTSSTLIHDSIDYDIIIEHPDTIGLFQGSTEYNKTKVPRDAPFNVYLKDQNVINVMKKGGDFQSIKSAIDSVTDASSTNRYVINIGAGVFTEETITMKPYITMCGSHSATKIVPLTSNQHIIVGSKMSKIANLILNGVTCDTIGEYAAIYYSEPTGTSKNFFTVENIYFISNDTHVIANGSGMGNGMGNGTGYSIIKMTNCMCGSQFNNGFIAKSATTSALPGIINMSQIYCQDLTAALPIFFAKAIGSGNEISMNDVYARCISPNTVSCFARASDGGKLVLNSITIDNWNIGIHSENSGDAPVINVDGVISNNNNTDILIEHPETTGFVRANIDVSKVINASDLCSMFLNDPINNGIKFNGPFNYSPSTFQTTTDISSLLVKGPTMGLIEGGSISLLNSGLIFAVTGGFGYTHSDSQLIKHTWGYTTLSVTTNADVYVYINSNNLFTTNTTYPNSKENLILGRVISDNNSIKYIDHGVRVNACHNNNDIDTFLKDAVGPVYKSGSIISATTIPAARSLNITAGVYYYGSSRFCPSATTNIGWNHYVGGICVATMETQVPNLQYDNNGTLTNLTDGYYTKHLLYLIDNTSGSEFLMIHGQSQYADPTETKLPIVPSFIRDSFVRIASIIVQKSSDNLLVNDGRPKLNSTSSNSNEVSNDHNDLIGLNDDSHKQYLLANGTRPMSGDLNLSGNNITNVGLINSIDYSSHASRHSFNGSDALAPALSSDITELTDNTTSAGINNTKIPRADHVHSHGNRGGGTLHTIATTSVAGFMSYLDKIKLNGIESGATNTTLTTATPLNVTKNSASVGTSEEVARADHKHDISTSAATSLNASSTNTEGSSTSLARADHTHVILSSAPVAQIPDQNNSIGLSSGFARADHVHNIPTAIAVSLDANSINSIGAASTFSRSNHTHYIHTGQPVIQTIAASVSEGSSANFARADHIHTFETGVAHTISNINSEGTSTAFSRSDHIHSHGNQVGGSLHAIATTSIAGFLSSSDKIKLNNIATGATKNDYNFVSSSSTFNYSSQTSITISGMSILPGAGNYLVMFNASATASTSNSLNTLSIFINGSEVASSIRYQNIYGTEIINLNTVITGVLDEQYVEIRVRISEGSGSIYNRSFTLIRI